MNVTRFGMALMAAAALFSTPLAFAEEAGGETQACDKAKTEACDKVDKAACDKAKVKACDKAANPACDKAAKAACDKQAKPASACGAAKACGK